MGIKGLWPILNPVARSCNIQDFSVSEGFLKNRLGDRALRLGIDAFGWIYRACYRHSATKNPELATLYARCTRLFQLPIAPLFVFDGPSRPRTKRGKHVRGSRHWIEEEFKKVLDAFGFPWIQAAGEADAELARLSSINWLDAILSEDVDCLTLGAKCVLRIDNDIPNDEQVIIYRADEIAQNPTVSLVKADLVLIALLAGGDYDSGIPGCGIETAIGLARAGFSRDLEHAYQSYSGLALRKYLVSWRNSLAMEMKTNRSGYLPRRCPSLAAKIPHNFPTAQVLNLYMDPVVSSGTPGCLFSKSPSARAIALFVEDHFSWGKPISILEHFADTIFPGLAIQGLVSIARAKDLGFSNPDIKVTVGRALFDRESSKVEKCPCLPETRMELLMPPTYVWDIVISLDGHLGPSYTQQEIHNWFGKDLPRMRVWVPTAMMEIIAPS